MKAGESSKDSSRSAGIGENACGVIEGSRIPSDCCFTKLIKTYKIKHFRNNHTKLRKHYHILCIITNTYHGISAKL